MLTNEQQKEVEARVQFKMEQFMDWLKNTIALEDYRMSNPTLSTNEIAQLWESSNLKKHILLALQKEIIMEVPYTEMYLIKRNKLKNEVVNKIVEKYISKTRGFDRNPHLFTQFIASQIERMV